MLPSTALATKNGGRTAGAPRRATTAGKGAEAWGLPLRHLLGFFMGAIWQFDYPRLGHSKAAKSKGAKSGVPNSSIALAFIIISERCYS